MLKLLVLALALTGPLETETGSLRISTSPSVEVYWEGVPLGLTDEEGSMSIERIPPGGYTVELAKPGLRSLTVEVEVAPGPNALAVEMTSAVRSTTRARVIPPRPATPTRAAEPVPAAEIELEPTAPGEEDLAPAAVERDLGPARVATPGAGAGAAAAPLTPSSPGLSGTGPSDPGTPGDRRQLGLAAVGVAAGLLIAFLVGRSRRRASGRRRRRSLPRVSRMSRDSRPGGGGETGDPGLIGKIRARERSLETLGGAGGRIMKDIRTSDVIEVTGEDPGP